MTNTVRNQLDRLGFDWESGVILFSGECPDEYGWTQEDYDAEIHVIPFDHEALDREFIGGYGSVDCPPIMAYDKKYVYFRGCYDGASWITSIPRNPEDIIGLNTGMPCVGGG